MIRVINSLLVTTAICGLLAATPALAASDASTGPTGTTSVTVASSNTVVTHTRLTTQDVTGIQKLLTEKGFYKSNVDGQFGPGTQEAMRAYQASAGLEANGYPTQATLSKLGVTPENAPVTGDAEPAGKGGVVYTETIENKQTSVTMPGKGSFAHVDSTSENGGSCKTCTNGPTGNGGTRSMHSDEF